LKTAGKLSLHHGFSATHAGGSARKPASPPDLRIKKPPARFADNLTSALLLNQSQSYCICE